MCSFDHFKTRHVTTSTTSETSSQMLGSETMVLANEPEQKKKKEKERNSNSHCYF